MWMCLESLLKPLGFVETFRERKTVVIQDVRSL